MSTVYIMMEATRTWSEGSFQVLAVSCLENLGLGTSHDALLVAFAGSWSASTGVCRPDDHHQPGDRMGYVAGLGSVVGVVGCEVWDGDCVGGSVLYDEDYYVQQCLDSGVRVEYCEV